MAALGGRSVGAGPIRSNVAPLHSCVNAPECARGDQKPSLAYVTFTPINLPVFPLLSPPLLASPSPRPPSVRHRSFSLCLLCSLLFASPLLSIQMPHPPFKRPPSGSHHALAFSSLRPFPSIHPSLLIKSDGPRTRRADGTPPRIRRLGATRVSSVGRVTNDQSFF